MSDKIRYWLCLTDLTNWGVVREKDVYGVTNQHKKWIDKLKVGDKVIMYVIPKKIGGLFEVLTRQVNEKVKFKGGEYPNTVKLKKLCIPEDFLDLNIEVVRNLVLFKNKIRWGPTLMGRSIMPISKEDYDYIKSLIG